MFMAVLGVGMKKTDQVFFAITYTGYGTKQDFAYVQGKKDIIEQEINNSYVEFKNVPLPENGEIIFWLGNNGGTIDISNIRIEYLGYTYNLVVANLKSMLSVENVESMEFLEDSVQIFTYDTALSEATLDFSMFRSSALKEFLKPLRILLVIYLFIIFFAVEWKLFNIESSKTRGFQVIGSFVFGVIVWIALSQNLVRDFLEASGDACDIWQTITSFYSEKIYGSYVLYKGINSVYPYVWLYQLALCLNVDELFFVRVFYCVVFSYVGAVGFPNMIELMTGKKTKGYRRCLCIILMWYFWSFYYVLTELMIDLPCLMYFVLLINAALKISRNDTKWFRYAWMGILVGLCMSASGQYTTPAVCVLIFILWNTIKMIKKHSERTRQIRRGMLYLALLVICMGAVLYSNTMFEETIVNPLRQEGAWIPSGNDWLEAGFVRFRENYRVGNKAEAIPSNRRAAIFSDYYGADLEGMYADKMLPAAEYVGLFMKYPIDFALSYLNSFFLILSPDHGDFNVIPLFIFYSFVFVAIFIGIKKCRKWNQFFSSLFWIGFSFLWATVPMIVMNIEIRNCIQIQGLIIALAVCDDTLWDGVKQCVISIKEKGKREASGQIPYTIVCYLVFVVICFVHMATLYDNIGAEPDKILIRWEERKARE